MSQRPIDSDKLKEYAKLVFGALGGANYNSPFAIVQTHVFMAMIAVLVGTAFLNSAALRDNDHRMAEIIYSTRLSKSA